MYPEKDAPAIVTSIAKADTEKRHRSASAENMRWKILIMVCYFERTLKFASCVEAVNR